MLTIKLLKEGRYSRPKKSIIIFGFISIGIIAVSSLFYLFASLLPALRDSINNFRVDMIIINSEFHLTGMEALKLLLIIPLSSLGAAVGAINLIRMSNRKRFFSALHIIPGIGFIALITGAIVYFFFPSAMASIPPEVPIPPELPYLVYAYGALAFVVGILIADVFAVLYPHINYREYAPIYNAYKAELKAAPTPERRIEIKKEFNLFWKKRRYEEMISLLFGHMLDVDCEEMLTRDAYEYLKEKALTNYKAIKEKELDELFKGNQNESLRRELALLSRKAADKEDKKTEARMDAEKDSGAKVPIVPPAQGQQPEPNKPAPQPQTPPKTEMTKQDEKVVAKEKKKLEKEKKKAEKEAKKEAKTKEKGKKKEEAEAPKPSSPDTPK